jgi:hypothetical protein
MTGKYYNPEQLFVDLMSIYRLSNDCMKRIHGSKNLKQNYDLLLLTMTEILNETSSIITMAEHDKEGIPGVQAAATWVLHEKWEDWVEPTIEESAKIEEKS